MINNYVNFIWDLDGTLVDSSPDILSSIDQSLDNCGIERFEIPQHVIGQPLQVMLSQSNSALSEKDIKLIISQFRKIYDNCGYEQTQVFTGVFETLAFLVNAGKTNFLVTNKPIFPTRIIIEKKRLSKYFSGIVCPDSLNDIKMTKPEMLLFLLKEHKKHPIDCIYIGDHEKDVEAAHACGIPCCIIKNGYGSEVEILKRKPEFFIENICMIPDVLFSRSNA